MSYAEDYGHDEYEREDLNRMEDDWNEGYHIDKNGNKHKLEEMEASHLWNTIKYFKGHDTSALEAELLRRQNNIKQ